MPAGIFPPVVSLNDIVAATAVFEAFVSGTSPERARENLEKLEKMMSKKK